MPRRSFAAHTAAFAELGQRLHAHRTALGISTSHLSHRTWLDYSYILRIENGQVNPTIDALLTLASALETDVADLVKGLTPSAASTITLATDTNKDPDTPAYPRATPPADQPQPTGTRGAEGSGRSVRGV